LRACNFPAILFPPRLSVAPRFETWL
jgi:hypothetical protein